MNILEKKWKLMQRDPLCRKFDEILCESFNKWKDNKLQESREKKHQEIKDKWHVSIYVPETNVRLGQMFERDPGNSILKGLKKEDFTGPFKWWTISGEPHPIVNDAREGSTIIVDNENEKVNSYSFKDDNLFYCESYKIPLIIDPSGLNMKDAEKVKKAVWDIVKKDLGTRKKAENGFEFGASKGERWNPSIPGDEPKELAQIFHSKETTLEKYLYWYDLKMKDISFRLIALVKKGRDPEEQKRVFDRVMQQEKKPKIGNRLIDKNGVIKEVRTRGESAVRRGFFLIYRAIYRTVPPTKEWDIQISSHLPSPKYDCPEHGKDCPPNCNYRIRWFADFDKIQRDVPLIGITADHMKLEKYISSPYAKSKRAPSDKDYSEMD